MGKTIMVSSHILPELADICNKIGIIERGVISVNAKVSDVIRQVRRQPVLVVSVADDLDAAASILAAQLGGERRSPRRPPAGHAEAKACRTTAICPPCSSTPATSSRSSRKTKSTSKPPSWP